MNSLDSLDAHQAWIPLVQGLKEHSVRKRRLRNGYDFREPLSGDGAFDFSGTPFSSTKRTQKKWMGFVSFLSRGDDFELEWTIKGGKKKI